MGDHIDALRRALSQRKAPHGISPGIQRADVMHRIIFGTTAIMAALRMLHRLIHGHPETCARSI